MNKLVRNFITFILSATIFICIQFIIVCNGVNTAITRDNFNKCIGTLNKKLLVENNGENFEQIIKEYSNKTNLSEKDIDKVLNSDGYSSIVGNYMIDENMLDLASLFGQDTLDSVKGLDDIKELNDDTEQSTGETLNSRLATRKQLEELFKELGVEYSDSDLVVFEKSLKSEVAPGVEKQVTNSVNKSSSAFGVSSITKILKSIFSNKTINVCKIIMILCMIGVVLLNLSHWKFFISFIVCSLATCINTRVLYSVTRSIPKVIGNAYGPAIANFTTPLHKRFLQDFNIFLFVTLILGVIYLLLNLVVTQTTFGDKIDLFGTRNKEDVDEVEYNEFHQGKFADEVDLEPVAYKKNELKDITFSNDIYVHKDIK